MLWEEANALVHNVPRRYPLDPATLDPDHIEFKKNHQIARQNIAVLLRAMPEVKCSPDDEMAAKLKAIRKHQKSYPELTPPELAKVIRETQLSLILVKVYETQNLHTARVTQNLQAARVTQAASWKPPVQKGKEVEVEELDFGGIEDDYYAAWEEAEKVGSCFEKDRHYARYYNNNYY